MRVALRGGDEIDQAEAPRVLQADAPSVVEIEDEMHVQLGVSAGRADQDAARHAEMDQEIEAAIEPDD